MLYRYTLILSITLFFFFLMIRRPPRSTRTDTLFPYTTLFRSEPGGVGLPLEPGERVRQARRRHQVLHHVVEAAAVHLPGLAAGAFGQAGALFQAEVEGDEVEGAADPGDAGNDVQPTHRQFRPLPKHPQNDPRHRSEEHTSELQSLMRISYAVFC